MHKNKQGIMSKRERNGLTSSKRYLVNELAEYYGVHRNTMRKLIGDLNLCHLGDSIQAILRLERLYGAKVTLQ